MCDQPMPADGEADAENRLRFEAMDFAKDLALSPVTSVPGSPVDLLAPYRFVVDEPPYTDNLAMAGRRPA